MYIISIDGESYEVSGCEAAWNAYQRGCEFGQAIGLDLDAGAVALVDGETGEVLADSSGYTAGE